MSKQAQQMNKYSVEVHGFGAGTVWAKNRTQAHYLVIKHLRDNLKETVPFTQPMQLRRLWLNHRAPSPIPCIHAWWDWDSQQEWENVGKFRLLGKV